MPFIDAQTGSLTLRIVYDGPPLAGKTTSVKALSQHVRGTRGFTSPAEANGRTLYFDWLEFVGGEYGGKELHVHVISVPGQSELRRRRKYLIDQADAVVFVADTRDGRFGQALELFGEVAPLVRAQQPPLGLVFQANKRDAPDALDLASVRTALTRFGRITLVDSVATDGAGIRDAFAMALRHALDRTQLLVDSGELKVSDHDFLSAGELLGKLQELDEEPIVSGACGHDSGAGFEFLGSRSELGERADAPSPEFDSVPGREVVFTPDAKLPSGQIWPPVDGRAIVHEASRCGLVPARTALGDWWASTGGWRFHSWCGAVYRDLATARGRLIEWARTHAAAAELLSADRALIAAHAGGSQVRLWQLVRVFPSLREGMLGDEGTAAEFTVKLRDAAQQLLGARAALARLKLDLRCSLWTIGRNDVHQTVFVGMMPSPGESVRPDLEGTSLLRRELLPIVRSVSKNLSLEELVDRLQVDDSDVSLDLVNLVRAAGDEGARAP